MAWTAAALCTVCSVTGIVFELLTRSTPVPVDFGSRDSTTASAVVFMALPIMGALIVTRRPDNPIGWLFIGIGATMALWVLADGAGVYTLLTEPGALAGGRWLAWFGNWLPMAGWGLVGLALLLFPTGHLPSPRWRPAAWAVVVVTIAFMAASALGHDHLANYTYVDNPAGLIPIGWSPATVKLVGTIALAAVGLPVVVSLVMRRRSAQSDERQQVKWLTWAALVTVSVILIFAAIKALGGRVSWAEEWVLLVGVLIPVAAGVAVPLIPPLRHRSRHQQDRRVRGLLAVFITAVYVGVVVGVGALLGAPRQPNLVLSIVATALVAVAFQPVRSRAQRLANRLVYGERATPYEVLSEFSDAWRAPSPPTTCCPGWPRDPAEGTGGERADVWLRSTTELRPAARGRPTPTSEPDRSRSPSSRCPPLPAATATLPVRAPGRAARRPGGRRAAGDRSRPGRGEAGRRPRRQAGLVLRNVRLIEELRGLAPAASWPAQDAGAAPARAQHPRRRAAAAGGPDREAAAGRAAGRRGTRKAAEMLDRARRPRRHDALEDLRDLARGIYPPLLADQGLVAALAAQAPKVAGPGDVEADGVGRYPQEVEAAVYFCCLEALQNVAKYAEASRAMVRLRRRRRADLRGDRRRAGVRPLRRRRDRPAGDRRPARGARRHARGPVLARRRHHGDGPAAGRPAGRAPEQPRGAVERFAHRHRADPSPGRVTADLAAHRTMNEPSPSPAPGWRRLMIRGRLPAAAPVMADRRPSI